MKYYWDESFREIEHKLKELNFHIVITKTYCLNLKGYYVTAKNIGNGVLVELTSRMFDGYIFQSKVFARNDVDNISKYIEEFKILDKKESIEFL
jgi:hypothetical protein